MVRRYSIIYLIFYILAILDLVIVPQSDTLPPVITDDEVNSIIVGDDIWATSRRDETSTPNSEPMTDSAANFTAQTGESKTRVISMLYS